MEEIVYFYPDGHFAHNEADHPERPERVESIRIALQNAACWEPYSKISPLTIPESVLHTIHSKEYLNLLEMTCKRGGQLDSDTFTTPASWEIAHRAAGGAAALASAVWEGKAKRGFALTRPPGHHATHGQGMGFCLLNNIAIACEYLIRNYGVERLAIIDLDLHHGNGTQDIFWDRDDVFYVSTHQFPYYPGSGQIEEVGIGRGEGWTANFPLPSGSGDVAYLTVMDELILPLLDKRMPQMILVSYGFDPHWMDPIGGLQLTANGYGGLLTRLCAWTDEHCDGKIALILEGGYDLSAAAACSLAVVSAMLGKSWPDPYPCPYDENMNWRTMVRISKSLWSV